MSRRFFAAHTRDSVRVLHCSHIYQIDELGVCMAL